MWMIGIVSDKEKKILTKGGYDVKVVDELVFNKMLDPASKSPIEIEKGDNLVAIFTDADVFEELNKCIEQEKANIESCRREVLWTKREAKASKEFENASKACLEIPNACEVIEHEPWEDDMDDTFIKKFYYGNEASDEDSKIGSFIVRFKPDTDKVTEVYSNI